MRLLLSCRLPACSVGVVVLAVMAGCATTPPPAFPTASRLSVHVSPDTVSTFTETAAEDYLIPDSQVFVSGRGSGGVVPFGLIGAAIGTEIDRSRNRAAIATEEHPLRLKFADELRSSLRASLSSQGLTGKYQFVEALESGDIVLLPSAKLTVADDKLADLSFRLTVRIRDKASGEQSKKDYYYLHSSRRPIAGPSGWSDNSATTVKDVAAKAFAQLSQVLVDDMEGSLSRGLAEPGSQVIIGFAVSRPKVGPSSGVVLKSYPDHVAVAPKFGERPPARGLVVVLERQLVTR